MEEKSKRGGKREKEDKRGKRERMTGGREKRRRRKERKGKGRRERGGRDSRELEKGEGQCAWRDVTVDFKVRSHTLTYHKQHAVPGSPPPVPLPPSSTTPPTLHDCWAESQRECHSGNQKEPYHNSTVHHGGQMLP